MAKRVKGVKFKPAIGWREWIALPDLAVPRIKVKVDTGARTSALHVFDVEPFRRDGRSMLRFTVPTKQRARDGDVRAEAEQIDERVVRSSGGHEQLRRVIRTRIAAGNQVWPIEITLTQRDAMGFRMLLGRQAIRGHFVVDPGRSYLLKETS